MAKKDVGIKENEDRRAEDEQRNEDRKEVQPSTKTEVKNAHASGLGSMGRSDEVEENLRSEGEG